MHLSRTTLAICYSLIALVLFDSMGLIIKYLSGPYGAAELSAYRNLFGLIPAAIALWSSRAWHQAWTALASAAMEAGIVPRVHPDVCAIFLLSFPWVA